MLRRNVLLAFAAGLLAGAVGAIAIGGGWSAPRAMAQGPQPLPVAQSSRYGVTTWAYPATMYGTNGSGLSPASHGAYLLDTWTGTLWSTEGDGGSLKRIGTPQPQ